MEASPTIIYQDMTGESQSATSTIKALLELQQTSSAYLSMLLLHRMHIVLYMHGIVHRASRLIECDIHAHLISKAGGSVISSKSPSPAFRWSSVYYTEP